jgi:hypothetical protein
MRLRDFAPGSRASWWLVTALMVVAFGPLGLFWGYWAFDLVWSGEIPIPKTNLIRYVMWSYICLASAACLGTIGLRVIGRPSAWLGWISVLLIVMVPFIGMIGLAAALAIVMVYRHWQIALGMLAVPAILLGALVLLDRRYSGLPDH